MKKVLKGKRTIVLVFIFALWPLAGSANPRTPLFVFNMEDDGLVSIDSSAGHYSETGYRYNGNKYVHSYDRYVDFSDPDSCANGKNRDVCP